MESRQCPECGEPIRGRIDKKFCGDMCRNSYNNKLNGDPNNFVRNINNSLRKNRRILEQNLEGDTTKVRKQRLIEKGFNFRYCTHVTTTRNNHTYTFCYEYGYLPLENDYMLIVKRTAEL